MAPDDDAVERGPLAGVTVLDLSSVGPASRCTRLLADYGAAVVKVGPVPKSGGESTSPPPFAYAAGRGTRLVGLDLRHQQGRQAFLALAERADVVVESFRPGVVERLGIDYGEVEARNPRIVYVSTTGYGQSGGRAGWAGHDLDYLAVGGFLAMSEPGEGGRPPLPGATLADAAAGGMQAALAVCTALVRRAATGKGCHLDVAVADGVVWLMSLALEEHLWSGAEVRPGHDVLSGRYACYGLYTAGDGRHVAVAAIEPKFFANLCRALGCDELVEAQYDDGRQEELRAALARSFGSRSRDQWVEELAGADTCVAPVLDIDEVAADPQFAGRRVFVEAVDDQGRHFRQVGALLAGMAPLVEPQAVAPGRSDGRSLLVEAGLSPDRVAELADAGVVA